MRAWYVSQNSQFAMQDWDPALAVYRSSRKCRAELDQGKATEFGALTFSKCLHHAPSLPLSRSAYIMQGGKFSWLPVSCLTSHLTSISHPSHIPSPYSTRISPVLLPNTLLKRHTVI